MPSVKDIRRVRNVHSEVGSMALKIVAETTKTRAAFLRLIVVVLLISFLVSGILISLYYYNKSQDKKTLDRKSISIMLRYAEQINCEGSLEEVDVLLNGIFNELDKIFPNKYYDALNSTCVALKNTMHKYDYPTFTDYSHIEDAKVIREQFITLLNDAYQGK